MRALPLLIAASFLGFALPQAAYAGTCAGMEQFKKGNTQVRTTTDAKGKVSSIATQTVKDVQQQSIKFTSTLNIATTNDKLTPINSQDFTITCDGINIYSELRMLLPVENMGAYRDYDIAVQGGGTFNFPLMMAVGKTFGDATVTLTLTQKNAPPSAVPTTITVTQKGRSIVSQESVTTPAGTWNAYKVHYDLETVTMSVAKQTLNTSVDDYYVLGLGNVKSVVYKNGDLTAPYMTTELTSIK